MGCQRRPAVGAGSQHHPTQPGGYPAAICNFASTISLCNKPISDCSHPVTLREVIQVMTGALRPAGTGQGRASIWTHSVNSPNTRW